MNYQTSLPFRNYRPFFLSLIILALLTGTVSFFLYNQEKRELIKKTKRELELVSDLKSTQIKTWKEERIADAGVDLKSEFFISAVNQFYLLYRTKKFNDPEYKRLKTRLNKRLDLIQSEGNFETAIIIDTSYNILINTGSDSNLLFNETKKCVVKAISSGKTEVTDFYYNPAEKHSHFDIVSPFSGNNEKPNIILVYRVTPDNFLYPYLNVWPYLSNTSETLLISQKEDSVVFITDLKSYKNNLGGRLSLSLKQTEVPAVKAVLGESGFVEGLDYAGEKVFAYLTKIHGSDWFLVTKINQKEVFESLNGYRFMLLGFSIILILLTSGLFLIYLLYNQNKLTKKVVIAHKEFHTSLYSIGDGIITTDDEGKIRLMNSAASKLTGWSESEAHDKMLDEVFWIIDDRSENQINPVYQVLSSGNSLSASSDIFLIDRTGKKTAISFTSSPIRNDNQVIEGAVLVFKDQTEERKQKLEIEKHRKRLQTLMSNLPGMAYRCQNNPNSTMMFVSDGCFDLTGFQPSDFINDKTLSFGSIIKEKYRKAISDNIQDALNKQDSFILEYEIICKNGDVKWVWEQGRGIFDKSNTLLHIEGFITDISDRKRAENILIESERNFKQTIEASPIAIALGDNNQNLLYLNKKFIETFGYTLTDIPSVKQWWDKAYPDKEYRDSLKALWGDLFNSAITNEGEIAPVQCRIRCKNGDFKHILVSMSSLENRNVTIFHDITERVNAENALKANERKFRQLHESMTEAFVMINPAGNIVEFNEAYKNLLGYSHEELFNLDYRKITPEKWIDFEDDIIDNEILVKGFSEVFEKEYIHKDGHIIPVELRGFLLRDIDNKPEFLWALVRDITERKRQEEILNFMAVQKFEPHESHKFYEDVICKLTQMYHLDYGLIGKLDKENNQIQTLAFCFKGVPAENFSYPLKGTPCENVIGYDSCFYPHDVSLEFPTDKWLADNNVETYMGVPLFNSTGESIGILVAMNCTPINKPESLQSVLSIVSSRVASEIERNKFHNELKANIERFHQVAENAEEWIWEVNSEGMYTYSNSQVYTILGYTPEEIINKRYFYDFFHPENREILKNDAFTIFKSHGIIKQFANRNIHKNGKEVRLSTNAVPILDEKGNLTGYRGVDVDMTVRRISEDTLRFIAERSWTVHGDSFFTALSQFIAKYAQVDYVIIGEVSSSNDTAKTLAFYSKGKIIDNIEYFLDSTPCENLKTNKYCFIHDNLQEKYPDNQLLKSMNAVSYFGIPLYNSTGVQIGNIALLDTEPIIHTEIIQLILQLVSTRVSSEIEQIRVETQLRISEEKFRIISEISSDYMFESKLSSNGRFELVWVSDAFEQITGFTMQEYIQEGGWQGRLHPDDLEEDMANLEKLRQGLKVEAEVRTYNKNNEIVWVTSNAYPVFDKETRQLTGVIGAVEDISYCKNSEKILEESERRMKTLLGNLPGMAYRCKNDKDWTKEFVSEGCFELTGYKPDDLIGNKTISFSSLILPKYRDYLWDKWQITLARQEKFQDEFQIITADGSIKWIWEQGQGVYNKKGEVIALEGFYTDITDRKHSEIIQKIQYNITNAIVESKNLNSLLAIVRIEIDALLDSKNFYVAMYNEETGMLTSDVFNDEKDVMQEWPANKSLTGYLIRQNKPLLLKKPEIIDLINKGESQLMGTLSEVWMGVPIVVNEKAIGALVVQNYDSPNAYNQTSLHFLQVIANQLSIFITNQEARETSIRLSKAVIQSPASIVITDYLGNIQFVNPKFTEVTGYAPEEVLGKNPRFLNSGFQGKAFYEQMWATILSGKDWHGEFHNLRKNGELFWESALLSPIFNDSGEIIHFIAVKEDITEKKKMFDELVIAKEKAEENDRLKSAFLANMSHEIRTPLNGILGFTKLLSEDNPNDEQRKQFIKIIDSSSERLLSVVNDILDISLIQSNQIKLFPENIEINSFIDELETLYQTVQKERLTTVELIVNKPFKNKKLTIKADRIRLFQVFKNLLDNAFKFTREGQISFGYSIPSIDSMTFYVKDSGIGISPDKQQAIFEAFQQADETTPVLFGGTGLGLSIASGLLRRMNGEIRVESAPGKGATFFFTLPYEDIDLTKTQNHITEPGKKLDLKRKTILLVEDDDASAKFLFEILNRQGAEVVITITAEEALEWLKNNNPELIMLDIRLPGMNGFKAIKIIKKYYPHIPVIAQTAFAMQGDADKALKSGFDAYISKPINEPLLFEKFKKLL